MNKIELFASPWWVNLLVLVPFLGYWFWRGKLSISKRALIASAVFAIAFAFVESSVVVYLRKIFETVFEVSKSFDQENFQLAVKGGYFGNILTIEVAREVATMVMLASVAFFGARGKLERWAIFLWSFAFWDIFYYVWLWVSIGWPASLLDKDLLFLIPTPWYSQVWFPIGISLLIILAVIFGIEREK